MADAYGWRGTRDSTPSRMPGPDNMGWWAGIAFLAAVVLHVIAFLALGRIQIALGFKTASPELHTAQVKVDQAEVLSESYTKPDLTDRPEVEPPKANKLLEELDVLSNLPEQEIDMKPQIKDPEFAASIATPALSGDPDGVRIDPVSNLNLSADLPNIGRTAEAPLSLAAEGQAVIDPGKMLASDDSMDQFTAEILKKGAGGKADKGTLDGVVTLDDMIGLPANVLVGKKTMLPGDLLFEYNSAELRESARVGLMKLALLISNNPNLYCWIEGYTDLYGGDAFNLDLSQRRADSVRRYLVGTLRLPADKIVTRGFGKTVPLVKEGNVDEQSPNRRVEIKMRRNPPPPGPVIPPVAVGNDLPPSRPSQHPVETPIPTARPVEEQPPEKAAPVLVKPKRGIEVEEVPSDPPIPKAKPVQEPPPPVLKATPVEDPPAPLKAEEVPEEEEAPRALEVGE